MGWVNPQRVRQVRPGIMIAKCSAAFCGNSHDAFGECGGSCRIIEFKYNASPRGYCEIKTMRHAYLPSLSADDYLSGELKSDIRHEYIDGEVYAMAGAGEAHNLIAGNVFSRLRGLMRGGPCRVFISDMKVRVAAWNAFYYPDVLVVCDAADTQPYFKESPCLIVEVLSTSTEAIDRREKLLAYRTLASLREYVLIAQDKRQVEVHRRDEDGAWRLETLEEGDPLHLECVGAVLSLDEVYEDVSLGE